MMKQLFSDSDLDRWMGKFNENIEAAIIEQLQAAGEKFVEFARNSGNYDNWSNNLRSSIGYVVSLDGEFIFENFQITGNGTKGDGAEGLAKGKKLAAEIASQVKGIVLVCVAGMNYAKYVEANGKEVISSSSLQVEMWLRKSIKNIPNRQ